MAQSVCSERSGHMAFQLDDDVIPYVKVGHGYYTAETDYQHGAVVREWRTYRQPLAPLRKGITFYLVGNFDRWPHEDRLHAILGRLNELHDGTFRQYYVMWIAGWNCRCHNCEEVFGTNGEAIHMCRRTAWFQGRN